MSLNNIQLPAPVLQDLYKNTLIDSPAASTPKNNAPAGNIAFLGNNHQHITIVGNDASSIYLNDDDLKFLMGILAACKLSMGDVALVNRAKSTTLTYTAIEEELNAATILLFGVEPSALHLPLQFPHYQVQRFNNQVYLSAPDLHLIAADKAEKTKLWNCLKQIFSIK